MANQTTKHIEKTNNFEKCFDDCTTLEDRHLDIFSTSEDKITVYFDKKNVKKIKKILTNDKREFYPVQNEILESEKYPYDLVLFKEVRSRQGLVIFSQYCLNTNVAFNVTKINLKISTNEEPFIKENSARFSKIILADMSFFNGPTNFITSQNQEYSTNPSEQKNTPKITQVKRKDSKNQNNPQGQKQKNFFVTSEDDCFVYTIDEKGKKLSQEFYKNDTEIQISKEYDDGNPENGKKLIIINDEQVILDKSNSNEIKDGKIKCMYSMCGEYYEGKMTGKIKKVLDCRLISKASNQFQTMLKTR